MAKSQIDSVDYYEFIINPGAYPLPLIDPILDGILGDPNNIYYFNNRFGQIVYWLYAWFVGDETVSMFRTVQLNKFTNQLENTYLAPQKDHMLIYNLYHVCSFPDRDLYIHDDIARADLSNSEMSIGTWAGDISNFSHLDWSILKGRKGKVQYIFDQENPDSFIIGMHLLEQMKHLCIAMTLHPYKKGEKTNGI